VDWQLSWPNLELGEATRKILDEWGPAGTLPSPTAARLTVIAMLTEEVREKQTSDPEHKQKENEFRWVSKTVWSSLQKKKTVATVKLHRESCRHAANELDELLIEELTQQSAVQRCELCKSTQKTPILTKDEPCEEYVTPESSPCPLPHHPDPSSLPVCNLASPKSAARKSPALKGAAPKSPPRKSGPRYVSSLEGLLRFPMQLNF